MTKASSQICSNKHAAEPCAALELICSTDSLVELRAAVDNGADGVKLNVRADWSNSSCFKNTGIRKAVRYAHDRQCKVLVSLESNSSRLNWQVRRDIVDVAAHSGVDGFVLSDPTLMLYAATYYPDVQLHHAIEDAALNRESIDFYRTQLGVSRLLLPRVLSMRGLEQLSNAGELGLAMFGFSRLTAVSGPSHSQALAPPPPAQPVLATHDPDLGMTAEPFPASAGVGCCATDDSSANDHCYEGSRTFDLNTLRLLPQLSVSGIVAIIAEAPFHAPMHLAQVTRVWREAIDDCLENIDHYHVKSSWLAKLDEQSKGMSTNQHDRVYL